MKIGLFTSVYFNEFLQHLEFYLKDAKIEFVEHSKYPIGDERRSKWIHWYPIGLLGGKVEIHSLLSRKYFSVQEMWEGAASCICRNLQGKGKWEILIGKATCFIDT